MKTLALAALVLVACAKTEEPAPGAAPRPTVAPSPKATPAPKTEGAQYQIHVGGGDGPPRLPFKITNVYEKQKVDGHAHTDGGDWTFFDAETPKGARFTFGFHGKGPVTESFSFGDAWLSTPERSDGDKLASEFAAAFKVQAPARGKERPIAPLRFGVAILGKDTARSPGGGYGGKGTWTATKLFPAAAGKDAEVFFNFSLAEKTGELSEKDADYDADVAWIFATGLRDGLPPK